MIEALAVALTAVVVAILATSSAWGQQRVPGGRVTELSGACPGQNAEVEAASDPTRPYVYELWIGCGGIGFARSRDGGVTYSEPTDLPLAGKGSWDPAVAVAQDGTVYVAFMVHRHRQSFPIVEASFDHGATFPRQTRLIPPRRRNWGDRPFLAAGPAGRVYVSWAYGPNSSAVKLKCYPHGSCTAPQGDQNIVFQGSTDHGRTFGPIVHVTPGYPAGGADSGSIAVEPSGRIDILYQGYSVVRRKTFKLAPGYEYFTASSDGGARWTRPVRVDPGAGTTGLAAWWIDGDLAVDPAGNLYATWDTQGHGHDTAWLAASTDHGRSWSRPRQASLEDGSGPHIIQVAAGGPGVAYVSWLTHTGQKGYVLDCRPFSLVGGWRSAPQRISADYGNPRVWPGDTIGITSLGNGTLVLSWGSATRSTGEKRSEIFARLWRGAARFTRQSLAPLPRARGAT